MTINKDAAARVQAQPTPEDRAKEALKPVANVLEGRVFASPDLKDADWICPLVDKMLAAVTTAIREAEQAAYERGRKEEREAVELDGWRSPDETPELVVSGLATRVLVRLKEIDARAQ